MPKILISGLIIANLLISGCTRGLLSVHRIDIQQGNVLESADVKKIKPGLTKEQVRGMLGSPVLNPVFNTNRWDYVFYLKRADHKPQEKLFSIYFQNDSVSDTQYSTR